MTARPLIAGTPVPAGASLRFGRPEGATTGTEVSTRRVEAAALGLVALCLAIAIGLSVCPASPAAPSQPTDAGGG